MNRMHKNGSSNSKMWCMLIIFIIAEVITQCVQICTAKSCDKTVEICTECIIMSEYKFVLLHVHG